MGSVNRRKRRLVSKNIKIRDFNNQVSYSSSSNRKNLGIINLLCLTNFFLFQVLILLCTLTIANAGVIHDYAPAPSVSTVYSSINTPVINTVNHVVSKTYTPISYTKTYSAPVYDSVLSTHQSTTKSLDGTRQDTLIKSLDTPFASVKKYDSRSTSGTVQHSVPTYSVATPLVHSVSPVTYPVASVAPPVAISTPIVTKTIASGLSNYASLQPVAAQPIKITYSEAPLVSHMTFTGLGTSYSW